MNYNEEENKKEVVHMQWMDFLLNASYWLESVIGAAALQGGRVSGRHRA